ncbi:MAG: hypothetical protein JEZ00_21290 [Anaerolineaceae bacterium]|nr:hypothetical protein [Anaerolineaceae bacterium]
MVVAKYKWLLPVFLAILLITGFVVVSVLMRTMQYDRFNAVPMAMLAGQLLLIN